MDNKKNRTGHLSKAQKVRLLDLMRERPNLRSGKFTKDFSFKKAQEEWEEIASVINAIPGSNKDWRLWRKTWQDLQSKAKSKKASTTKLLNKSGGGPPPEPLDDFEEGVVSLINNNSITGHEGVSESQVQFVGTAECFVPIAEMVAQPGTSSGIVAETVEERPNQEEDVPVVPPPPAFATVASQDQGSTTNGRNKGAKKIIVKSLMKEKLELKKMYIEHKIKFQNEFLRVEEERNKILKEIGNKLG